MTHTATSLKVLLPAMFANMSPIFCSRRIDGGVPDVLNIAMNGLVMTDSRPQTLTSDSRPHTLTSCIEVLQNVRFGRAVEGATDDDLAFIDEGI
jgi:hypothetical protein